RPAPTGRSPRRCDPATSSATGCDAAPSMPPARPASSRPLLPQGADGGGTAAAPGGWGRGGPASRALRPSPPRTLPSARPPARRDVRPDGKGPGFFRGNVPTRVLAMLRRGPTRASRRLGQIYVRELE